MAKKKVAPKTSDKLRIRMYCQGLGDCFLLTFPRSTGTRKEFHILIDCGVIIGQPGGTEKIKQVADQLKTDTQGRIDVLVVTHEHWDHVSGFHDAASIFEGIQFDEVWLSWMEDPDEPMAVKLQQQRDAKKQKLAIALDREATVAAMAVDDGSSPIAEQLIGLAGFLGLEPGNAVQSMKLNGEPDRGKTGAALNFVKARTDNLWYLEPGSESFSVSGLDGIEFFVLGPPRDEKSIAKDQPTKKGDEVFHQLAALAAFEMPDDPDMSADRELPFASKYGITLDRALNEPFYRQMYDDGTGASHPADWRRINDLWMYSASELALQLDADTNNTSLVLAIRLPSDKILLFPGDAQVGNWESWHSREYNWGPNKVSAEHLLKQTIVYKVGHHGSHNATLRDKGLMMMSDSELTALLPVDEDVAHNKKHWKKMPFVPMLKELRTRTNGRILRPDHDLPHPETAPTDDSEITWIPSAEKVTGLPNRSLYLDYFVPLK
jgi:hypothetical protein